MAPDLTKHPDIEKLSELLADFPHIRVAALFGSMARGTARPDSDIDVAVQADKELRADERIALTEAIALAFNRPVDLWTCAQPGSLYWIRLSALAYRLSAHATNGVT